jgi:hypothetical protein
MILCLHFIFFSCFNAVLIRLVSQIKITLLLKKQQKHHLISYVKIVYKHNMMGLKVHARKVLILIKDR